MPGEAEIGRRRYLQTASGAALATIAFTGNASAAEDGGFSSKWARRPDEKILEGTKHETGVYINGNGGPTAVIVAGQHGDEMSSQFAAMQLTKLAPSNGKLVIIPIAHQDATYKHQRQTDIGNLNRHWPSGAEPTSELARAIWNVITDHDPDVAFDLHTSIGLYGDYEDHCDGVGQALFPTRQGEATANTVIDALNEQYINPSNYPKEYRFLKGNLQTGQNPLLSHKYGGDLNIPAWLFETTDCNTALVDQIAWQTAMVTGCLKQHNFTLE